MTSGQLRARFDRRFKATDWRDASIIIIQLGRLWLVELVELVVVEEEMVGSSGGDGGVGESVELQTMAGHRERMRQLGW